MERLLQDVKSGDGYSGSLTKDRGDTVYQVVNAYSSVEIESDATSP